MIENLKVIALIPARGGSKGVKDKNIKPLNGIPLIGHTICEAKKSNYIDYIFVSTDSEKIRAVSVEFGAQVPFLRNPEYATDTSKTIDAVMNDLTRLKNSDMNFDILVLLQPTSPLRTVQDIDNAIKTYVENGFKDVVSISESEENPVLMRCLDSEKRMSKLLDAQSTVRRQDMVTYYKVNGAIYVNNIEKLSLESSFNDNPIPYIMKKTHSVDIDTIDDFALAEYYINKGNL